ncbi:MULTISPECIES: SPOR domain-containing protein [unclassified Alcanivorax]|uniref:SPOR domain-containing protein n=1 Tax=unclassified Alcanivorax TaxID=2638842 RepID=UPI000AA9494F|nr:MULTISPECIES: SPOR domain-containing protein [unclassified Alcanivorax]
MDNRARQRIVGIVLLLILAGALAPFLFRTPEQVRNALDMRIPEPPEHKTVLVEPVVPQERLDTADERIVTDRQAIRDAAEQQLNDEDAKTVPKEPEPVTPVKENAPVPPPEEPVTPPQIDPADGPVLAGFVVQTGSYSDADNASGMVDKLKDAGYRAYIQTDSHEGKVVHRVMVGPEIRKDDAESTRQKLADDERFKLKGLVRIYVP